MMMQQHMGMAGMGPGMQQQLQQGLQQQQQHPGGQGHPPPPPKGGMHGGMQQQFKANKQQQQMMMMAGAAGANAASLLSAGAKPFIPSTLRGAMPSHGGQGGGGAGAAQVGGKHAGSGNKPAGWHSSGGGGGAAGVEVAFANGGGGGAAGPVSGSKSQERRSNKEPRNSSGSRNRAGAAGVPPGSVPGAAAAAPAGKPLAAGELGGGAGAPQPLGVDAGSKAGDVLMSPAGPLERVDVSDGSSGSSNTDTEGRERGDEGSSAPRPDPPRPSSKHGVEDGSGAASAPAPSPAALAVTAPVLKTGYASTQQQQQQAVACNGGTSPATVMMSNNAGTRDVAPPEGPSQIKASGKQQQQSQPATASSWSRVAARESSGPGPAPPAQRAGPQFPALTGAAQAAPPTCAQAAASPAAPGVGVGVGRQGSAGSSPQVAGPSSPPPTTPLATAASPSASAGAPPAPSSPPAQPSDSSSPWKLKLQQNSGQQPGVANGLSPDAAASGQQRGGGTQAPGGGKGPHNAQIGGGALSPRAQVGGGRCVQRSGGGNRPTGSFSHEPGPACVGLDAMLEVTSSGTVLHRTGPSAAPRLLRLVRGLRNDEGESNCFLNVVVQSLWHLEAFREAVLGFHLDKLAAKAALSQGGQQQPHGSAAAADVAVMRALGSMFRAMSQGGGASAAAAAAATNGTSHHTANGSSSPTSSPSSSSAPGQCQSSLVSPNQLREALSGSGQHGRAAIRIERSEMHDASEVMSEILCCLHRAELGKAAHDEEDLQLPHRVRARVADMAALVPLTSTTPAGQSPGAGGGGGYAAALSANMPQGKPASANHAAPNTTVHRLFGLDVQVPSPLPLDDGAAAEEERRGPRRPPGGGAQAPPAAAALGSAPGKRVRELPAGMVEVLQYTKWYHLVPAHGLRKAHAMFPDASTEEILRVAEASTGLPTAAAKQQQQAGAAGGGGEAAALQPHARLLRSPEVFTLAVVWESPQVRRSGSHVLEHAQACAAHAWPHTHTCIHTLVGRSG